MICALRLEFHVARSYIRSLASLYPVIIDFVLILSYVVAISSISILSRHLVSLYMHIVMLMLFGKSQIAQLDLIHCSQV